MVKIFLDSGHGGHDGGAVGNGIKEKDIVLKIAKKVESKLKQYSNVQVKMSRSSDRFLSLSQRTNIANSWGADAFVSIHCNSATNKSANGFESFIYTNVGSKTKDLQDDVHSEIMRNINNYTSKDRGQKTARFHVLRNSNMSAILTECLFISNRKDASLMKQDAFIDAIAEGHTDGLVKHFNLRKNLSVSQPKESPKSQPQKTNEDTLYKVQIGAFRIEQNARDLEEEAKEKDYDVFISKEGDLFFVQIGSYKNRKYADALKEEAIKDGFGAIVKTV